MAFETRCKFFGGRLETPNLTLVDKDALAQHLREFGFFVRSKTENEGRLEVDAYYKSRIDEFHRLLLRVRARLLYSDMAARDKRLMDLSKLQV